MVFFCLWHEVSLAHFICWHTLCAPSHGTLTDCIIFRHVTSRDEQGSRIDDIAAWKQEQDPAFKSFNKNTMGIDRYTNPLLVICIAWCFIEILFALVFYYWIIPKANKILDPAPYRDYGRDRHKLLLRILRRIERTCHGEDVQKTILNILQDWFHTTPLNRDFVGDENSSIASTSPENSSDEDDDNDNDDVVGNNKTEPSNCLYKEDMDDFLAWAFFGKHMSSLIEWEQEELAHLYEILQSYRLSFPSRTSTPKDRFFYECKPRKMSLEPVNALYRPLLVYVAVFCLKVVGGIILHLYGYRRFVSTTGLVVWHRPAIKNQKNSLLPMLFFHGIAPTGLVLYLPMLLGALATEPERPIFLIENHSISCTLDFKPLSEQETVDGVMELLARFQLQNSNLSLVGHSFGSCPITWILASNRLPNVRQVVLLDPVAILLSEHDVMVNFLYAEELDKIRMLASSELFTEKYLRRHFAWYNSELWLDTHIDKERCQVLICIAEKDEIINAAKVKREILRHSIGKLVYWTDVGHGDCITSPTKWKQIKTTMLEQELRIVRAVRSQ